MLLNRDEAMDFFRYRFIDDDVAEEFSRDDIEEIIMALLGYSDNLSQIMKHAFKLDI